MLLSLGRSHLGKVPSRELPEEIIVINVGSYACSTLMRRVLITSPMSRKTPGCSMMTLTTSPPVLVARSSARE
jgi:hypothetical protein